MELNKAIKMVVFLAMLTISIIISINKFKVEKRRYNLGNKKIVNKAEKVEKIFITNKNDFGEYKISREKFEIFDKRIIEIKNIAMDKGNIGLIHKNGWTEFPYKKGKIIFSKGFVAALLKEFVLNAIATTPDGICAYNDFKKEIVWSKSKKYKFEYGINEATSMAYYKNYLYISDKFENCIFKVKLESGKAIISEKIDIKNVQALASDKDFLYYSISDRVYKSNSKFEVLNYYDFNTKITDFTVSGDNEFLVVNIYEGAIYRFKIY